jgi:putative intracellular protease/amidase
MPDKAVHLLVVEGFADWEPAHAVAELRRHGHYHVESVGLTMAPVRSMGGITVLPSKTVADMDPAHVAVFILPGGDRWERSPIEPELEAALRRVDRQSVPIAAICAATVAISRLGLLKGRRHTSNGLDYSVWARMFRTAKLG